MSSRRCRTTLLQFVRAQTTIHVLCPLRLFQGGLPIVGLCPIPSCKRRRTETCAFSPRQRALPDRRSPTSSNLRFRRDGRQAVHREASKARYASPLQANAKSPTCRPREHAATGEPMYSISTEKCSEARSLPIIASMRFIVATIFKSPSKYCAGPPLPRALASRRATTFSGALRIRRPTSFRGRYPDRSASS